MIANAITLPNDAISGDKVEGGTIAAITITDLTTTTLNVTHLTSSFVTSSTIITEGSNIFGDAAADTHTFNGGIIAGNITASGNISASGLIVSSLTAGGNLDIGPFNFRTRTLQSDVGTGTIPISISSTTKCTNLNADLLDDQEGSYYTSFLNATGNITASNISASGTIQSTGNITSDGTGSFTDGRFTGNVGIGTTTPQNPLSVSGSLTVFTSNNTSRITVGEADDSGVSTNNILAIEVDGNANKSHTFTVGTGNDYIVETLGNRADIHLSAKGSTKFGVNNGSAYNFTQQMILTGSTGNLGIGTSTPQSKLTVNGDTTTTHITASGNISSSGIITGEGLVISDDALITDDLEVQGNISGSSASTITIGGKLQAGSKSFLISKPEGGKLEYGVLEGQQNDVFFRGELKSDNVIHLPQEWEWLVDENTITIQLTSIGKHQELFVKEIKDNKIFIGINGMFKTKENIHCYHVIHGTRKDIELIRNHQ